MRVLQQEGTNIKFMFFKIVSAVFKSSVEYSTCTWWWPWELRSQFGKSLDQQSISNKPGDLRLQGGKYDKNVSRTLLGDNQPTLQ